MRDHTKLRAFQFADELACEVYKATAKFPKEEVFGMTAQMRRAAVSVPSNIVEGSARDTQAEYLRFLDIAYGSARELQYQVSLARKLDFLPERSYQQLQESCDRTTKTLNSLIRSLRRPDEAAEGRRLKAEGGSELETRNPKLRTAVGRPSAVSRQPSAVSPRAETEAEGRKPKAEGSLPPPSALSRQPSAKD
jgi:four helix bundle protein